LARYGAVEGALASGFATAELHHVWGHDPEVLVKSEQSYSSALSISWHRYRNSEQDLRQWGSASTRPQWFSTDEKGACRAWLIDASRIGAGRDQVGVSLRAGLRASLKPACGRLHPFGHASLTHPLPQPRRLAWLE
ncbi:hypothetical protein NKI70_29625, partial [Mesorhizobium sp. M0500]